MGSESKPAKGLLPYLQCADELQKHEPLVAYYCRLYAMEKVLRIPQKERTKTTNSILISFMNQLEKNRTGVVSLIVYNFLKPKLLRLQQGRLHGSTMGQI